MAQVTGEKLPDAFWAVATSSPSTTAHLCRGLAMVMVIVHGSLVTGGGCPLTAVRPPMVRAFNANPDFPCSVTMVRMLSYWSSR